jgi:curved DNA-binding protein
VVVTKQEEDLYSILGVARDASQDEIRTAYRQLAREHHPDVNPDDAKAEERFKAVASAYGVLSEPEKRQRYDEFGTQGLREGFDPNQAREYQHWARGAQESPFSQGFDANVDLEDLLRGVFSRGGRRAGPQPGSDARGEVQVDFMDAVRGGEVSVQFQGRGLLRIKIPPGAENGTKIRLKGQGDPGPGGGPAGDLYLTLQVRPHAFFVREGRDLTVDLPVSVSELILGADIEVPTPDGPVTMKVPPGSQNGRKLRLREKGALGRAGAGRGDLYVKLVAQLPESDDPRLAELAEELESLYGDADLRGHLKG